MKTWQQLKENPLLFQRYFIKEYLIKACRKFFEERNYHELESPILTSALPQERYLDVLDTQITLKGGKTQTAYLIPTTETFNKKVLAAGLGEHFVITRVMRGTEEIDVNHAPEFTMLEWYHLNATYNDLMKDCEELFLFALKYIKAALDKEDKLDRFPIQPWNNDSDTSINYLGLKINLEAPWHRISIPEALEKYASLKLAEIQDENVFRNSMVKKGYKVSEGDDWQIMYEWLFANEIEPNLPQDKPVFVFDYPKQICVLTKVSETNPLVCERVEIYFAGKEVGNGYTELIDWKYQEAKFMEENAARKKLGMKDVKIDYDLIEALKSGLPNVAGIGIGLDRIAMILANTKNISDVNYFPATEW